LKSSRSVTISLLCAFAAVPCAAGAQSTALVGSWRGRSTCVDREHFPSCHDEQVIFDIVARGSSGDSVTVRADKIVQGHREFMGESVYARGSDSVWVAEFRNERVHIRLTLRLSGTQLIGRIIDVPSGRTVRDQALTRIH
jgi:hypothetical protein